MTADDGYTYTSAIHANGDIFVGVVNEGREKLRLTQEYRVGIRPDGRYCLACGKPLYGPELSHTPPAQPSAVDRLRHG